MIDQRVSLVTCVADCATNFMCLASLQYSAFVSRKNRQVGGWGLWELIGNQGVLVGWLGVDGCRAF